MRRYSGPTLNGPGSRHLLSSFLRWVARHLFMTLAHASTSTARSVQDGLSALQSQIPSSANHLRRIRQNANRNVSIMFVTDVCTVLREQVVYHAQGWKRTVAEMGSDLKKPGSETESEYANIGNGQIRMESQKIKLGPCYLIFSSIYVWSHTITYTYEDRYNIHFHVC